MSHRDCVCGEHLDHDSTLIPAPAKDWIVTELIDHGRGAYYRYTTRGINLNYPPCHPDRWFSWRVPDLDDRYDLSAVNATITAAEHQ